MKKITVLVIILILMISLLGIVYFFDPLEFNNNPDFENPDISESTLNLTLSQVFPIGSFDFPTGVYFHEALNQSSAWIIELKGRIISVNIENGMNKTLLDIRHTIGGITDEEGLVGLAFDPQFDTNGYIYIHYTTSEPLKTYISRYTYNGSDIIPSTELILLKIDQPYANHNGGGLIFGPDNMLYIGLGDGGDSYDPHQNGQNRKNLLSTILRIDPKKSDENLNYTIPAGNPYVGNSEGYREEIFAYGIRNPYKMSLDPITGKIWIGDVGQNDREEVNILQKGGNYGWSVYEGTFCKRSYYECDSTEIVPPYFEYSHDIGSAIIGGIVYRGNDIPELYGNYIFGDWLTGQLFSINSENPNQISLLFDSLTFYTSSISQDTNNEIYLSGYDGSIYKLME